MESGGGRRKKRRTVEIAIPATPSPSLEVAVTTMQTPSASSSQNQLPLKLNVQRQTTPTGRLHNTFESLFEEEDQFLKTVSSDLFWEGFEETQAVEACDSEPVDGEQLADDNLVFTYASAAIRDCAETRWSKWKFDFDGFDCAYKQLALKRSEEDDLLAEIVKKRVVIEFDTFRDALVTSCVSNKTNLKAVVDIYIENRSRRPLSNPEERSLFEILFRMTLDESFLFLLQTIIQLLKVLMRSATALDNLRLQTGYLKHGIFQGHPERVLKCGRLLSVVSPKLSAVFYDELLFPEAVQDIDERIAQELIEFPLDRPIKESEERLLILCGRLHATEHLSDTLFREIRLLKSKLPKSILSGHLRMHEALTRMAGYHVARSTNKRLF